LLPEAFEVNEDRILRRSSSTQISDVLDETLPLKSGRRHVPVKRKICVRRAEHGVLGHPIDYDLSHDRDRELHNRLVTTCVVVAVLTHGETRVPDRDTRIFHESSDAIFDTIRVKSMVNRSRRGTVFEDHTDQVRHILSF